LSCELESKGHRSRIAYLYPHAGDVTLDLRSDDLVLGGDESSLFEKLPGIHPGLLGKIRRLIDAERPDLVQVNGARSVKYGALARRLDPDAPWVLVYRNTGDPLAWIQGWARQVFYRRLVLPQVEAVVGVSSTTLERLHRFLGKELPSLHIPRAIEPERLVADRGRTEVRAELRTPEDAPVILFAASLAPEKRPDRLLRVAERVRAELPNLHLWVAGEGRLRGEAEAMAHQDFPELEARFLGARDDVPSLMKAADLLMLPSDTEGIPGVLLEASWLGLAVAATRVGGVAECVLDGETGLLAEAGDEAGLAAAAVALLGDPARRAAMGQAAAAWVRERFTISRIAPIYETFYREVLANSERWAGGETTA